MWKRISGRVVVLILDVETTRAAERAFVLIFLTINATSPHFNRMLVAVQQPTSASFCAILLAERTSLRPAERGQ